MNWVFGFVSGAALGCMYISTVAVILVGAKELGYEDNLDTYGFVSGCYIMFTTFGHLVGSVFGGAMLEYAGFEWSLTVISGLFVTCGMLSLGLLSV
ncbi:MFS-type transporter SLC18B1-like [Gigantopelta aegis]|uniref:MFS-type transporter SLC18B1-like n=1 Tax=Gigantopelta aegis TaxID=1735272 RepID=UPI001B88E650|nr:MFS-type transporter SLC18B1-like [Gigantopelta aegis]